MSPPSSDRLRDALFAPGTAREPERSLLSSPFGSDFPAAALRRSAPGPASSGSRDMNVPGSAGRRKLWQIQQHLHCLVIGTCLSIDQVRRLATRAGFENDALSDYDIHHACVHAANDRQHPLTLALQRACEARHARHVRRFARVRNPDELRTLWRAHRDEGDIAGPLWALVTHAGRDDELIVEVFGEVHMLQHGTVSRENTLRQGLVEARSRSDQAVRERDEALERSNALRIERDTLSNELDASRLEFERLRARLQQRTTPAAPDGDGRRLQRQERLIVSLRERDAAQRGALLAARSKGQASAADVRRLECVLTQLLDTTPDDGSPLSDKRKMPNEDAPTLCGRCVLVIGGQPRQCRHFRALVEAHDGVFLHHDGGVESKATRVADLVRRADAVLCPTEQISHDAMRRAKRLCRADAKPMLFLQRSSLAAFADGLATLSGLASTPVPPVPPVPSAHTDPLGSSDPSCDDR